MNFSQWLRQLNAGKLISLLVSAAAALLCITVHEAAHAWTANRMGDPTARERGRLSLNPLHHIDPLGLICMIVCGFGWARPVPIDPRRFRRPKLGMGLTALAGPVSNVLLAIVLFLLNSVTRFIFAYSGYKMGWAYVSNFLLVCGGLSAGLAVFNLFPIPPLDGSKVFFLVLSEKAYWGLMRYERYGMLVLMLLLFLGVLDGPLQALQSGLVSGLLWATDWPFQVLSRLLA